MRIPDPMSVLSRADRTTCARVTGDLQSAVGNRSLARLIADSDRRLDRAPQTQAQPQDAAPTRAELARAEQEARQLAERATALQPQMDEAMRTAFRADDETTLSKIADYEDKAGTSLDVTMAIRELANDIAEWRAKATGTELAKASKFAETLVLLNKWLAGASVAFTLIEKSPATAAEQGAHQAAQGTSILAALSTLADLPAPIALYLDMYIVPLTRACVRMLGQISERLHEINRDAVELMGEPLYPGAEPGGMPMWKYMTAVIKAGAGTMPSPPADVAKYFVDKRDLLQAGTGQPVPVEGWIWKDLKPDEFPGWMADHRNQVWAMLYGSMQPPR